MPKLNEILPELEEATDKTEELQFPTLESGALAFLEKKPLFMGVVLNHFFFKLENHEYLYFIDCRGGLSLTLFKHPPSISEFIEHYPFGSDALLEALKELEGFNE